MRCPVVTTIGGENQTVVIEDLNVRGMLANARLSGTSTVSRTAQGRKKTVITCAHIFDSRHHPQEQHHTP
jgi:hypothetical protein